MKYVLTWWERPGGSAADHEAAQKRILDIFQKWEIPETLTFHQFLVRVGEFGGYAALETDNFGRSREVDRDLRGLPVPPRTCP